MTGRDAFSSYHPIVNFIFFGEVLVFAMFLTHPAGLLISLVCALGYRASLNGAKALRLQLAYLLPMMLLAALVNPAFNHRGVTVLAYFPSGNPLTLESVLFGVAAAVMLAAVVTWFGCYSAVMTSDKFIYLFGRVIPALSLLLSMTLRFVPRFKEQFRAVAEAQRCLGRSLTEGPISRRWKNAVTMLSILLTWSLENAIETADSMKSRGYGLPGRTAFSIYRLDDRDKGALLWLLSWGFFLVCAWGMGGLAWSYFPGLEWAPVTPLTVWVWIGYLCLCLTPLLLNWQQDRVWRAAAEGRAAL